MKSLTAKNKKFPITLVCFCACLLMIGCSKKTIKGDYYIEQFTEGDPVYYIQKRGVDSGGGVFDGIVKQVAWKGDEVVADVVRLSSTDANGWYKLNMTNGLVEGPIPSNEVAKFTIVNAELFFDDSKNGGK
jgi:hypothetical protein